ncbi:MAG: hypothetical protein NW241_05340 [Bacteroidia bacterium]|nr:hypothetical protein [Bacteroidia bacterium]
MKQIPGFERNSRKTDMYLFPDCLFIGGSAVRVMVMVEDEPNLFEWVALLNSLAAALQSLPDHELRGGVPGRNYLRHHCRQSGFVFRIFFEGLEIIPLRFAFA